VPVDERVAAAIGRWKRRKRQGWTLHCLQTPAGDLVCFGYLEDGAEPEPDRTGQYELPVE
jgi:hypothetical protein